MLKPLPPNPDSAPFIESTQVVAGNGRRDGRRRRAKLLMPIPNIPRPLPLHQIVAVTCLLLPWITPFVSNPSPSVWPWLVAAFCVAMVLATAAFAGRGAVAANTVRRAWVLAAASSAVIGVPQYFALGEMLGPWVSDTLPGEAFGNLRQRNQFASLMSIGLVALVWRNRVGGERWVPLVIVLLAFGNAASGSRTGSLQWVLILILAVVWHRHGGLAPLRTALLALVAYVGWALLLPWLLAHTTGVASGGLVARFGEAPGCQSRLTLWSNVFTLIAEKPWLGWGWGELDYAHYITLYPGERFCDILDNAHSLPLHLAVELGIPVALAVCSGLAWLVWRQQPWREEDPSRQMAWAVLALIGLHSLLEYPLWYGPFQIACGLCVYLLWRTRREVAPGTEDAIPAKGTRVARCLGAVALALGVGVIYAGWDYHRVSQLYLAPAQRDAAYREDTLQKAGASRLFSRQVEFAELSLTPLTSENALRLHGMGQRLLHYSPEPRVIEKVIDSAVMLGRTDEALYHAARYRAAFPRNHAKWAAARAEPGQAGP